MVSLTYNGWRYGLVKADHYRPVKEQNLIQPLLTIPHVINWCGLIQKIMKAKMSFCKICNKAIRVIIESEISKLDLQQFEDEVKQNNLGVKYIPIEDYNIQSFCKGKCSTCL